MRLRRGALAPTLFLLLGASCHRAPVSESPRPVPVALPAVVFPSGSSVEVELAITPEERAQGLMFRASMDEGHGMLFFGDSVRFEPFWMKNCHFPIDIIWLDQDRRFVSASYDTPPCEADPCPTYPPAGPSLFELEVVAGRAKREGLRPGDRFTFRNLPAAALPEPARSFAVAP